GVGDSRVPLGDRLLVLGSIGGDCLGEPCGGADVLVEGLLGGLPGRQEGATESAEENDGGADAGADQRPLEYAQRCRSARGGGLDAGEAADESHDTAGGLRDAQSDDRGTQGRQGSSREGARADDGAQGGDEAGCADGCLDEEVPQWRVGERGQAMKKFRGSVQRGLDGRRELVADGGRNLRERVDEDLPLRLEVVQAQPVLASQLRALVPALGPGGEVVVEYGDV